MPGTSAMKFNVGIVWSGGICPEVVLGTELVAEVEGAKGVEECPVGWNVPDMWTRYAFNQWM